MTRQDHLLFHGRGSLFDHLQGVETKAKEEIDRMNDDRLLNTAPEDLVDYLVKKYSVEPVALHEDDKTMDLPEEIDIDIRQIRNGEWLYGDHQRTIRGTRFRFHVPFTGDADLLHLQPSSFTMNPPRATVGSGVLTFEFTCVNPEEEQARIGSEVQKRISDIQNYLRSSKANVDAHNAQLLNTVRAAINSRRERILKARSTVSAFGIPIRQRSDAPNTYAVPNVRKKVVPTLPPAASTPFAPEPALDDAIYEQILNVLQNMAVVLERTPSAFSTMDEEALRTHFLVQLNGQFEGKATGETFNVQGKTDILIRENGRNIFIAECKFWTGPKGFQATIDQLLGYTSWRDTKTAIILFNRKTDFSAVVGKIPDEMRTHPNFKRGITKKWETCFQATFHQKNDPNREVALTVLAFDVPR